MAVRPDLSGIKLLQLTGKDEALCLSVRDPESQPQPVLLSTDLEGNLNFLEQFTGLDPGMSWHCRTFSELDNGKLLIGGTSLLGADSRPFLILAQPDGTIEWSRFYGAENFLEGINAAIPALDSDPGFLLTGSRYDSINHDIFLVKTDLQGNLEWADTLGFPDNDLGVSLHAEGGFYYLAGYSQIAGNGRYDLFWVKLGPDAQVFDFRSFDSGGIDIAEKMIRTPQGFLLLGNKFPDEPGIDTRTLEVKAGFSENPQWFVVMIDEQGNKLWEQTGPAQTRVRDAVINPDGTVQLLGDTLLSANNSDLYMVRIDENGPVSRAYTYGGEGLESGAAILPLLNDQYLLSGTTENEGIHKTLLIRMNQL